MCVSATLQIRYLLIELKKVHYHCFNLSARYNVHYDQLLLSNLPIRGYEEEQNQAFSKAY